MTKAYDILVVGGGIAGLWAAKRAVEAGFSVLLADKGECGGGASGGPLGALLPHLPDAASEKRRFQWCALHELSHLIGQLEEETALTTGYRRCGRVTPIRRETFLKRAHQSVTGSLAAWHFDSRGYSVSYLDPCSAAEYLPTGSAPFGAIFEDMAARVEPRRYTAALAASLAGHAEVRQDCEIVEWNGASGTARTRRGDQIIADRIVVAAGVGSFPLLSAVTGRDYGHGVKGQAAVFGHDARDGPILYDDGVYVVPHGEVCAVGSTSEPAYDDPDSISEARLEPVVRRVGALMPALLRAKRIAAWAGVRPRAAAKDPVVGCLDPEQKLFVLTGGYKVSFGIAHRLAAALIEDLSGQTDTTGLPETYRAEYHAAQANLSSSP